MADHPPFSAHQRDPRQLGGDLVQAIAEALAHNSRFLDDVHGAKPQFFRGTVTALQSTAGVRQVRVQRTGQGQPDGYWYPILDAGYSAAVGDDVLLVYTDRRMSACVIGARTQTSPASSVLSTAATGESFLTLTVTNNSSTSALGGSTLVPVSAGGGDYVVQCHLSGTTAQQVWAALGDRSAFSDLKVLIAGAEIDVDIDQVTNGAWSAGNQTLWFKLQRPVPPSGTDSGYQLRVGGPSRSGPPRAWANLYPFSDDFAGSSVDGTKWSGGNATVTVAGSVATVHNSGGHGNEYLQSVPTFGPGYLAAMYGTLPPQSAQYAYFGFRTGSLTYPFIQVQSTIPGWNVEETNATGSSAQVVGVGTPDGSAHVFWVARNAAGQAYGAAGATASGALTSYPQTGAYALQAEVNDGSSTSMTMDWVKVRPFVFPEPTCAAGGALGPAGGLRWEPLCTVDGGVVVDTSGAPLMALSATT